jgi:hypothetical protein
MIKRVLGASGLNEDQETVAAEAKYLDRSDSLRVPGDKPSEMGDQIPGTRNESQ